MTGAHVLGPALLIAAVAWPLALTALWLVAACRRTIVPASAATLPRASTPLPAPEALRATRALPATMALPALLLALVGGPVELRTAEFLTGVALGVDTVGRPFLLLTALLWSVVGWQAHTYMQDDPRRDTFTGFMLVTGTGNIGLTLALDALSFYLFFAVMTFAAYGLVVHTRTPAARRAGRIYIGMAVLGEALLMAGLLIVLAHDSVPTFPRPAEAFALVARPELPAMLLLFGLGVKAGLLPVHMWLPLAHPVAPTPASALLSGSMIKAGVLGWLRFLPIGSLGLTGAGGAAMALGATATIAAAVVGVTQRDVKTVLAYSSISQIGFLTIGIGTALAAPQAAPMLVLAVVAYAVHHAIAKAALFLGVAVVHGGRPRWLIAAAALPALVLAGAPLTSGAIAKLALKNALVDVPLSWLVSADTLLSSAAIATTLLMARYLALLAFDRQSEHVPAPTGLLLPWLTLVLLSVVAGLWLPIAVAPLGELPLGTEPHYIAAALWPLVLGVVLAGASLLLRRQLMLAVRPVPAGDIVVLLERATKRPRRAPVPLARLDPTVAWTRAWRRFGRGAGAAIDRVATAYDRVTAGAGLGVIMIAVALLLYALLGRAS